MTNTIIITRFSIRHITSIVICINKTYLVFISADPCKCERLCKIYISFSRIRKGVTALTFISSFYECNGLVFIVSTPSTNHVEQLARLFKACNSILKVRLSLQKIIFCGFLIVIGFICFVQCFDIIIYIRKGLNNLNRRSYRSNINDAFEFHLGSFERICIFQSNIVEEHYCVFF